MSGNHPGPLIDTDQPLDSYFLDRVEALNVALQRHVIEVDGIRRPQLCYFDGQDFDAAPANMIAVPLQSFGDLFSSTMLPLPQRIVLPGDMEDGPRAEALRAFAEMLDELVAFRADNPAGEFRFGRDSYFFSARDAFREAVQQKYVDMKHPTIFGLQVCYYDGEPFADAPPNMIHVPAEHVSELLLDAPTRLPTGIRIPAGTSHAVSQELLSVFETLMQQVQDDRAKLVRERMARSGECAPRGNPERLRVMFATTRTTQVLQYATFGLARAFEALGHEVHVAIESNAMEHLDGHMLMKHYVEFLPDVFIVINHHRNTWLHPDVTYVAWYQDLMPPLEKAEQLNVRDNDQVYSAFAQLDPYLQACGVSTLYRQAFCVDSEVFHPPVEARRREAIVFVGSAYAPQVADGPRTREMRSELEQAVARGEVFTEQQVYEMADRMGVDRNQAFWALYHYVTRDFIVHWMCEMLPAAGIEVEVYGRYWDRDPLVAPFFRGEVSHGEALADLYRQSRYSLVCHPFDLGSQRLVEVAACGCIPVVHDCRAIAEKPHWDDQCLYFSTPNSLVEVLADRPVLDPMPITAERTYLHFARTILQRREAQVGASADVPLTETQS